MCGRTHLTSVKRVPVMQNIAGCVSLCAAGDRGGCSHCLTDWAGEISACASRVLRACNQRDEEISCFAALSARRPYSVAPFSLAIKLDMP